MRPRIRSPVGRSPRLLALATLLALAVLLPPSGGVPSAPSVLSPPVPAAPGPVTGDAGPCVAPAGGCLPAAAPASPLAGGPLTWYNVSRGMRIAPPPLTGASMLYDPIDNYLVMFGGCTAKACPAPAQTWKYSGGAWTNLTNLSAQPPARTQASFVFDDRNGYALLFGGWAGPGHLLNDTWSFLGGRWTNLTGAIAPAPRRSAGLVYDHVDNEMVLFGGCGTVCPMNDTWRFLDGNWTDLTAIVGAAPPARWGAGFVYDAGDAYALLVDGCGASACPLNDSWSFVRDRWTLLLPPLLPPARFGAGLGYDGGPNATFLVGGNSSRGPISDTWRYAGGRWTDVTSTLGSGPPGRSGAAFVPTTNTWPGPGPRRWPYLLLFGGTPTGCLPCAAPSPGDTWVLEPILTVTPTALPTVVEVGQPVAFSATAASGTAPYIYLWLFGDGTSAFLSATTHAYAQVGSFKATVNATDASGAWALSTILVSVVAGPSVSATVRPNPVDAGRPVTFLGSAAGGTAPYGFVWTFGDGASATSANATHLYTTPGSYPINLTATDAVQGEGIWSGAVVVHPVLHLTARAATSPAFTGAPVNFSATPSGGTPPYTVYWSFGDSAVASGTAVSHTFPRPGTFNVTATVIDATGNEVATNLSVVVGSPPPPPPPPPPPGWYPWGIFAGALAVGGIVGAVTWDRRRHHRGRPPATPLAAAAVGEEEWERAGAPGASSSSRSMRRSAGRGRR